MEQITPSHIIGLAIGIILGWIIIAITKKPHLIRKVWIPLILFLTMLPFMIIGFLFHFIKSGFQNGYDFYDDAMDNVLKD